MRIDALARERHFADHLAPIWHALEPAERGDFYPGGPGMAEHLASLGIAPAEGQPRSSEEPILVAGWGDLRGLSDAPRRQPRGFGRPGMIVVGSGMARRRVRRPVVFVEHGAGQSYSGVDSPSYSGGSRRDAVELYLAPGPRVERANAAAYPDVPTAVVGCPKLDRWHLEPAKIREGLPVVAFSFHWDAWRIAPEAASAWQHYAAEVEHLARMTDEDRGFRLLGHGHPRRWPELEAWWESIGVEPVADFAEVLARADVYACDNSSTLYEFASCGRPVLVLNAPWYRREVEHGLRFWSHAAVGLAVDEPAQLADRVRLAALDPPDVAGRRAAVVADVYAYTDGRAAARAAEAIRSWWEARERAASALGGAVTLLS